MDPTVQQHSEWVEFPLATAFLVVFIFDMDRKTDMVELSTMGKSQQWREWQPEERQNQKWCDKW